MEKEWLLDTVAIVQHVCGSLGARCEYAVLGAFFWKDARRWHVLAAIVVLSIGVATGFVEGFGTEPTDGRTESRGRAADFAIGAALNDTGVVWVFPEHFGIGVVCPVLAMAFEVRRGASGARVSARSPCATSSSRAAGSF